MNLKQKRTFIVKIIVTWLFYIAGGAILVTEIGWLALLGVLLMIAGNNVEQNDS